MILDTYQKKNVMILDEKTDRKEKRIQSYECMKGLNCFWPYEIMYNGTVANGQGKPSRMIRWERLT